VKKVTCFASGLAAETDTSSSIDPMSVSPHAKQLLDLCPQSLWLANCHGQLVVLNRAWLNDTGVSQEASLGHYFWEFFHPDDQNLLQQYWREQSSATWQEQVRLYHASSTYIWVMVRAERVQPELNTAVTTLATITSESCWESEQHPGCMYVGIIERLVTPATDLSPGVADVDFEHDYQAKLNQEVQLRAMTAELEARLSEEAAALVEQESRFRATFEQAAMGCAHVSLEGYWLMVNQKLCEIVGYTREELAHKTFQDITHPDDLAADLALVHSLYIGEIPHYTMEKRYYRKDGSIVWVQITISLWRQPNPSPGQLGVPVYFIAMIEDISRRKHLEIQDLENRRALEAAKQALERQNQELDQFVYMASHDLKAPLRGIANLSEWLEEDLGEHLPPENREQLQLMRNRVQRMEKLVSGLLRYSRVGREKMETTLVNVRELLNEVIDSVDPPPGFMIHLPQQMPSLRTQRLLLAQVFTNLISNAIKHHDQAEGYIVVDWQEQADVYLFAVSDDGPGIPSAYQETIFKIFQTLSSGESTQNTGIGLAIIKKIVDGHGGKIRVCTNGQRGSRFEFTWRK
jgi:PAS domain S-box-containing protein